MYRSNNVCQEIEQKVSYVTELNLYSRELNLSSPGFCIPEVSDLSNYPRAV